MAMIYNNDGGLPGHAARGGSTVDAAPAWEPVEDLFSAGDVLRHRLRAGAELLSLLAEQTEAAESGDAERAARLDARRRRIERELAHASVGPVEGEPRSDVAAQIARLLDEAVSLLEARSEEEQRQRDWIELVQDAMLVRLCRRAA